VHYVIPYYIIFNITSILLSKNLKTTIKIQSDIALAKIWTFDVF